MGLDYLLLISLFGVLNVNLVVSKCIEIKNRSCLSDQLQYNWTSLPQSMGNTNETGARQQLESWLELKIAPTCWGTIAPFLCRTYIPKCVNGRSLLPCKSVCHKIRSVCGVIPIFYKGTWPTVLQCEKYHTRGCVKVCIDQ